VVAVVGCSEPDCSVTAPVQEVLRNPDAAHCGGVDWGLVPADLDAFRALHDCVAAAVLAQQAYFASFTLWNPERSDESMYVGHNVDGEYRMWFTLRVSGNGGPRVSETICGDLEDLGSSCDSMTSDLCFACIGERERCSR